MDSQIEDRVRARSLRMALSAQIRSGSLSRIGMALAAYTALTSGSMAETISRQRAAQPEPAIVRMNSDGSVIKSTGQGLYERFVQNQGQCHAPDAETPTWSSSGAFLGYVCRFSPSGG
jgi:hypothetical protein